MLRRRKILLSALDFRFRRCISTSNDAKSRTVLRRCIVIVITGSRNVDIKSLAAVSSQQNAIAVEHSVDESTYAMYTIALSVLGIHYDNLNFLKKYYINVY